MSEFCGVELDTVSFTIDLRRKHWVNPTEIYKKIKEYHDTGEALDLVIGGKIIGNDRFTIQGFSAAYNVVYRNGNVYSMSVDISLEEYTDKTAKVNNDSGFFPKLKYEDHPLLSTLAFGVNTEELKKAMEPFVSEISGAILS